MNENSQELDNYLDNHYIHRSNWLRASVLGANDGILSTASLAIGVAAATDLREPIILATLAGRCNRLKRAYYFSDIGRISGWSIIYGSRRIRFGKFSD